MGAKLLVRTIPLLLLAGATAALPVRAQQPPRTFTSQQVLASINQAVFAEAARWKAKLQSAEAAAIERIESQRAQIAKLRGQANANEAARRKAEAEIATLERDTDRRIAELLGDIDHRKDEVARLIGAFRRSISQLAETAEGREALRLYNENRIAESDALIARLDEQELAAQRLGLRLNEAARFRRRAELMLPKIGQPGATTGTTIALFEQAVERDPDNQRDWVNLAGLYASQRQVAKAEAAAGRARALAATPMDSFFAHVATGHAATAAGNLAQQVEAAKVAMGTAMELLRKQPELAAMAPDDFKVIRSMNDVLQCTSAGVPQQCYLDNLPSLRAAAQEHARKPLAERAQQAMLHPYAQLLIAYYYVSRNEPQAVAELEALAESVRAARPGYETDIESLDLLSTAYASIAGVHLTSGRRDLASEAYRQAIVHRRAAATLDPTMVAAKLELARALLGSGLMLMMDGDDIRALGALNEARALLRESAAGTDSIDFRRLTWGSLTILALIDPGSSAASDLLADMDAAERQGLLNEAEKAGLADLRNRIARAGAGGDLLTEKERAMFIKEGAIPGKLAEPAPEPGEARN